MPGLMGSASGVGLELDLPRMAPLPGITRVAPGFCMVSRLRGDPQSDGIPLDGGPDGEPERATAAGELPRLLLPWGPPPNVGTNNCWGADVRL